MKRSELLRRIREKQREIAIEMAQKALEELGITLDIQENSPNIRKDINNFDIGLLYFLGWSTYKIASKFGLSPSGVEYRLKKMGIFESNRFKMGDNKS